MTETRERKESSKMKIWQNGSGLSDNVSPIRLLLVEDDPQALKIITAYLEPLNLQISTASNGIEALEILRMQEVDIVVSDYLMPLMGGWELVKRIRADARLADLPLVLLTAKCCDPDDNRRNKEYLQTLNVGCLTKPCSQKEIIAAIREVVCLPS